MANKRSRDGVMMLVPPRALYARACAYGNAHACARVVDTCTQMASFTVCSRGGPRSTVDMYGCSKTIARFPCTPPSTLETCGEKISAEACSGKEIAGLDDDDDTKIVKSRVSGFSRAKLEAGRNVLGLCVQLNMSPKVVAVCFQGLARRSRRVRRRFVRGSREISLVSSLLRASTDALITSS